MTREEFWSLTEDQFNSRLERYQEEQKREDLRFGVVAAAFCNLHLKEGSQPIQPGSFFGHEVDQDYEMSTEETVDFMKSFAQAHNAHLMGHD